MNRKHSLISVRKAQQEAIDIYVAIILYIGTGKDLS